MNETRNPDFFADRGIPEEIWRARPYVWWTPEDPTPATELFARLDPGQRAFVAKLVHQAPGYAIVRRPPPMTPPLADIYPELRPLEPVRTQGPRTHWHGDGEPPADLLWYQTVPGTRTTWQPHIDRPKDHPERARPDEHRGVNTEELHEHQALAKYVFPSGARMTGAYVHTHEDGWKRTAAAVRPAKREAHIDRQHEGHDVAGVHTHEVRVPDPDAPAMAKRLDVHPMAVQKIIDEPVVFFVIEGCIKADAVLAAGAAVFSVPSVSLWACDELKRFAIDYLRDKVVVIVPDADWTSNDAVINQARMCQAALYRLDVPEIHVAAPPPTLGDRATKGVDDFIGAGGHLEDLLVIDSEPPEAIHDYVLQMGVRRDRARRDEAVIWALSTYTGPNGKFAAPLRTLARLMGMGEMSVSRSIRDLEDVGALTVDGDVTLDNIARDYFSRQRDWKARPTIILAPELRSADRPEQRLGDLVELHHDLAGVSHD